MANGSEAKETEDVRVESRTEQDGAGRSRTNGRQVKGEFISAPEATHK